MVWTAFVKAPDRLRFWIYRVVLPIPRRSLPESILSQPIPNLSERQYVVDKAKKSVHQLQNERETFWYRDELLKPLSASWFEVDASL